MVRIEIKGLFQFILFPEFQNISGLAVERFAYGIKCAESNGFCFARFQVGYIGQGQIYSFRELVQGHFSPGHHDIKVYYNRHSGIFIVVMPF